MTVAPERAVEDWLRRMGEVFASESTGGEPSSRRLTPQPSPPVLSSMELLKRRAIPGRQVHALTYRDIAGNPWFWIIRLIEVDDGSWRVCGGGGGGGSGELPGREAPWINFAACWGEFGLALGGRVVGSGTELGTSARLRLADMVLVDDVESGVVLFVTSEPTEGSTAIVELLASDGSVLWSDVVELDD